MIVIKAKMITGTYMIVQKAQYIHVFEYSECFVMDAHMFWRSLWGSVVFMFNPIPGNVGMFF